MKMVNYIYFKQINLFILIEQSIYITIYHVINLIIMNYKNLMCYFVKFDKKSFKVVSISLAIIYIANTYNKIKHK